MRQLSFTFTGAALALALLSPQTGRAQDPICSLPADVGPCDGACPRWYHDSETGQCEEFLWGCCEGNENNFETRAECELACPPDICSLPVDPGPCRGSCPRWYHDSETGRCEPFIWGCCDGNANNFETQAECEAACPPDCPLPGDPSHLLVAKDGIDLVLTWDDAVDALGWNVHRDGWRDPSTWGAAHGSGVTDADPVLDGIQFRDAGAVLGEPLFYYLITAINDCGESPRR